MWRGGWCRGLFGAMAYFRGWGIKTDLEAGLEVVQRLCVAVEMLD
jgi:hypothetical protein